MCLDLGPVFGGSGFHRSCQEAPCSLQLSEHLGHVGVRFLKGSFQKVRKSMSRTRTLLIPVTRNSFSTADDEHSSELGAGPREV